MIINVLCFRIFFFVKLDKKYQVDFCRHLVLLLRLRNGSREETNREIRSSGLAPASEGMELGWKKFDTISPPNVCRNVPSLAWPTSLPSSTTKPLILTYSHPKSDGKRHSWCNSDKYVIRIQSVPTEYVRSKQLMFRRSLNFIDAEGNST